MMTWRWLRRGQYGAGHGRIGLALLIVGESLILVRLRPVSDFYFPFVWVGFTLFLDAAVYAQTGRSLYMNARRYWLALFPLSAAFWWLFELFNQVVHNWIYIGAGHYSGVADAAIGTIDFSTVVPAVWTAALFVNALLSQSWGSGKVIGQVPGRVDLGLIVAGVFTLILPLLWPHYAYGLIWGCLALLLDPINDRLGRPSIIGALWKGAWRVPVSFALGTLMCGFFWEAWNFWAMPKWIYDTPYVNFFRIFEMPLLGWLGYLPFGLELFAMTNFMLPLLRLEPLSLPAPNRDSQRTETSRAS